MPVVEKVLERERELERLTGWVQAAVASHGSVVALEGVAGIGKSTLLEEVRERARAAGMRVLSARGGELERDFLYGVVRQLLEPALRDAAPATRERLLAGAAALARPALWLASEGDSPGAGAPGAIPHGLYWLCANLASERPLLVVVDDAHWADAASVAFLSYLARRIEGLPVLVVYAARPGEGAASSLPAAGDPERTLCPAPLSASAAATLVGDVLGGVDSAALTAACHHASGGNPFLLRELLRDLERQPDRDPAQVAALAPAAIAASVLARLDRLGDAARELVFAVAVLGTRTTLRHAAALAELDQAIAGDVADALADAAILDPGRPLDFAHPVLRATVDAQLAPARRSERHRRAAELLDADGADADAIAPHLLATEPAGDRWTVARLRAAADGALDRGAPEQACACLARAVAEPPATAERATVLCELGAAEVRAGRPEAIEHLRAGLEGTPDDGTRLDAVHALALALTSAGRVPEASELLSPVIRELGDSDPEALMATEADMFGIMHIGLDTAARAHEAIARHDGRLTGATRGERLLIACFAFQECLRGEDRSRTVRLSELALGDGRLLAEQTPDSHPFSHAVISLVFADRLTDAERWFGLALDDARRRGSALGFAVAANLRSHVLFRAGRIAEAESDAWAGFEAARSADLAPIVMMSLAYLVDVTVERGDLRGAERMLVEARADGELPPTTMAAPLFSARGQLRLAAGDADGARSDFEQLLACTARWGQRNPGSFHDDALLAQAHALAGALEPAQALAAAFLARARRWGAPSTLAVALRTLGMVTADIDLLRESVAAAERSPARVEHARCLVALGSALRRSGLRTEAREPLRAALDLAHRGGARRLADGARDELVAAGGRPRRRVLTGLDALTPSERRVAQLAADGLANREIAQALFVATRTVEMHLTNAYRKLGVGSRDALPTALRD